MGKLINFLDPKLLPKITEKPPCTEHYDAENLISTVCSEKIRGFIAFPSTKPPVELEFEFVCNVNIWYIFLNTSVGNQRCSGIELFSKTNNTPYVSIGRAVYNTRGLIFCNKRSYSKSAPPPSHNATVDLHFFNSGAFKSFLNASKLKIVIFRTEKSVPCLASVEIWGVPAKSCSEKTVETMYKLSSQSRINVDGIIENKAVVNNEPSNEDSFIVPDEFKDDLTYELMTIPYTLPCGKSIDHTTLEKHVESEKSFGRKPGDPFTGRNFTQELKPILNVGLKSRIDMFLLKNSHRIETFQLKRSLRTENNIRKKAKRDDPSGSNFNSNELSSTSNSSEDQLSFLMQKAKADPNFISFTEPAVSVRNTCISCKKPFEYLYELPCEHCYCRKCLLIVCKDCVCVECKKKFQKSDVKKIHV